MRLLIGILLSVLAVFVGVGNGASSSGPCTPDEHTVGLWHFDRCSGDTVKDYSASGNDGVLINGASWDPTGHYGCCVSSDGLDDRIRMPHHSAYDFGLTGDFTVELWFASQDPKTNTVIQHQQNPWPYRGWGIGIDDSVSFKIEDGAGPSYVHCPISDYLDGEWHHLAVVRADSGTTLKIYLHSGDGTRADSSVATVTPRNVDTVGPVPLYVADHEWEGNQPWEARIDEVRISDVARSPDEFCGITYPLSTASQWGLLLLVLVLCSTAAMFIIRTTWRRSSPDSWRQGIPSRASQAGEDSAS